MDAFLRPPAGYELDEKTARLKTTGFLREIQKRLKPGGLVAINLIETDPSTAEDLAAIRSAFAGVSVFGIPETRNLAVMARTESDDAELKELLERAALLEEKTSLDIGLTKYLKNLRED